MTAAPEEEQVGTVEVLLAAERDAATVSLTAGEAGVAVVRQFVAGMAEALGVNGAAAEDVKLAATEATTNALVHAWPEADSGRIEVEVAADGNVLVLTVRDDGSGPPTGPEAEEAGFGLSLIRAVADTVDVVETAGGGTTVEARFRELPRAAETSATPGPAAALRRVLALLAAHAGFTMDRLSDAVLVAETLAVHAGQHTFDGAVRVAAEDRPEELRLMVGPLVRGGGEALLDESELPAFGRVLEHLADEVVVDSGIGPSGPCEYLRVRLASRRD